MRSLPLVALLLLALASSRIGAQEPAVPQPASVAEPAPAPSPEGEHALSVATLTAEIERLRADLTLADEERDTLLEPWQRALAELQRAAAWDAQAEADRRAQVEAPALLAALQAEIQLDPGEVLVLAPPGASFSQLEQLLAQAEAELLSAQHQLDELESRQRSRLEQRALLPDLLASARNRRDDAETALQALGREDVSESARAERFLSEARLRATRAEILAYEQELEDDSSLDELFIAQRTKAVRRVSRAERLVKDWRVLVNASRRLDAQADAKAAQVALADARQGIDIVKPLADRNLELAELRQSRLGQRIEEITSRLDQVRADLAALEEQKRSVEDKYEAVAAAGATPAIGLLLKEHRDRLLDVREHRAALAARELEMGEIQLQQIDFDQEHRRLVDLDRCVAEFMAALPVPVAAEEFSGLQAAVREQFQLRSDILQRLLNDYSTYLGHLIELRLAETRLVDLADEFKRYIDERVLWVRIAPPLHANLQETWAKTAEAFAWLLDADDWAALAARVPAVLEADPLRMAAQILLVGILLFIRPALRRRIVDDAYLLGRIRTDRFTHTVRTTLLTALLASGPPLLLWLAAIFAEEAAGGDVPLGRAVAAGLRVAALGYLPGEFLWTMTRRRGLAEAHLRWPVESLKLLRRHLQWLLVLGLPVLFVIGALSWLGDGVYSESLGRLAFMTGQLLLAVFAWRVLRPATGVFRQLLERQPGSWTSRLRWLWFPLVVGMPLSLLVMAEMGYMYTAQQLHLRATQTALLVSGLVLVHALLTRWLFVARRQLGLAQHRKRRAAAQAEGGTSALSDEIPDEAEIDIPSVSAQSQRLVHTLIGFALVAGILVSWMGVLPALSYFDAPLWTTAREQLNEQGIHVTRELPVTLQDVLLAGMALLLTVVAARNLPGLLEITVLQRLPFERAGRYAITTISRYLITVLGLAFMFGTLGIGWETVQWLAAGISVGLGFGLQEIFANFVAGLILLFERPIRVGDTVTVGTATGTVNRIHMRATTIVTWDRTELVVPNKEFITHQIVNWTLSDSVLRVVIKVGIACGSDTKRAEEILYRIAAQHPDVLKDPKPRVVFAHFGESSLDFELRLYVDDPELFRTISHPINSAIDREFRAAGIEIAFPQRDLHLRSSHIPIPYIPVDVAHLPQRDRPQQPA